MSLNQVIRDIAKAEAVKAFQTVLAVSTDKPCITLGKITAIDPDTNKATIVCEDGTIITAPMTGMTPKGVGVIVQLVGQIII